MTKVIKAIRVTRRRWLIPLIWVVALTLLVCLSVLPVSIGGSGILSISVARAQDSSINYPSEIKTDQQKLNAIYSLLEQMRLEYNRQGIIAKSDWKENQGKWEIYNKIYGDKVAPLHAEYLELKESIRKANYTDEQWKLIQGEERLSASLILFGDKEVLKSQTTEATSPLIDKLKAVDLTKLDGQVTDPFEDWTGYTETDASGYLTVAANQITITNANSTNAARVQTSKGAAHFGATFTHLVSAQFDNSSGGAYTPLFFWAVANTASAVGTTDPIIFCYYYTNSSSPLGNIYDCLGIDDGATDQEDFRNHGAAWGTRYYYKVDRNATDTDCYIYTDSARTALDDTLTVAKGTTTFEYIYGTTNWGGGSAVQSGVVYGLDLQEFTANIANAPPDTLDFGLVVAGSTRYASGFVPSNPVSDNECYYTLTNDGSTAKINAHSHNATSVSVNWTLGAPGQDTYQITAYQTGKNPTTEGVVLTYADQQFIASLTGSGAHTHWDFKVEFPTIFTDGSQKTFIITLTAVSNPAEGEGLGYFVVGFDNQEAVGSDNSTQLTVGFVE